MALDCAEKPRWGRVRSRGDRVRSRRSKSLGWGGLDDSVSLYSVQWWSQGAHSKTERWSKNGNIENSARKSLLTYYSGAAVPPIRRPLLVAAGAAFCPGASTLQEHYIKGKQNYGTFEI